MRKLTSVRPKFELELGFECTKKIPGLVVLIGKCLEFVDRQKSDRLMSSPDRQMSDRRKVVVKCTKGESLKGENL